MIIFKTACANHISIYFEDAYISIFDISFYRLLAVKLTEKYHRFCQIIFRIYFLSYVAPNRTQPAILLLLLIHISYSFSILYISIHYQYFHFDLRFHVPHFYMVSQNHYIINNNRNFLRMFPSLQYIIRLRKVNRGYAEELSPSAPIPHLIFRLIFTSAST